MLFLLSLFLSVFLLFLLLVLSFAVFLVRGLAVAVSPVLFVALVVFVLLAGAPCSCLEIVSLQIYTAWDHYALVGPVNACTT